MVLITGATGFIGGRLAEVAVEHGLSVVGLVRTWARAGRLARLGARMIHGDILDPASLRRAMRGCDTVFHCAVDTRAVGDALRRSIVEGTTNVLRAAREEGAGRVVHLSSVAVYSYAPRPDAATEEAPYRFSGDPYCDGKIDAERIVLRAHGEHGLRVTVLRPTVVYGPFSPITMETVADLRAHHMVLVDGGSGICNTLYVDNLVEAMLLAAAAHAGAVGEAFHVSDARPVSWRTFVEAHARALGDSYLPVPEMTRAQIAAARVARDSRGPSSVGRAIQLLRDPRARHALRSIPAVGRTVRAGKTVARALLPAHTRNALGTWFLGNGHGAAANGAVPGAMAPLPTPVDVQTRTTNVVFGIEKARRVLGYDPQITFEEGMERTAAWIRWARL